MSSRHAAAGLQVQRDAEEQGLSADTTRCETLPPEHRDGPPATDIAALLAPVTRLSLPLLVGGCPQTGSCSGGSRRSRHGQNSLPCDREQELGARSPHAGGWFMKTLSVLGELHVHYATCSDP